MRDDDLSSALTLGDPRQLVSVCIVLVYKREAPALITLGLLREVRLYWHLLLLPFPLSWCCLPPESVQLICSNTWLVCVPTAERMPITTIATSTRMSAYSTNPCPLCERSHLARAARRGGAAPE